VGARGERQLPGAPVEGQVLWECRNYPRKQRTGPRKDAARVPVEAVRNDGRNWSLRIKDPRARPMTEPLSVLFVSIKVSPNLDGALVERRALPPNKREEAEPIECHVKKITVVIAGDICP